MNGSKVDLRLVMECRFVCFVWLDKYVSCGIDRAWEFTSHWAMESCERPNGFG